MWKHIFTKWISCIYIKLIMPKSIKIQEGNVVNSKVFHKYYHQLKIRFQQIVSKHFIAYTNQCLFCIVVNEWQKMCQLMQLNCSSEIISLQCWVCFRSVFQFSVLFGFSFIYVNFSLTHFKMLETSFVIRLLYKLLPSSYFIYLMKSNNVITTSIVLHYIQRI